MNRSVFELRRGNGLGRRFIICAACYFICSAIGVLCAGFLSESGCADLAAYIHHSAKAGVGQAVFSQLRMPVLLLISGMFVFGNIASPILISLKGFAFTFTVSAIMRAVTGAAMWRIFTAFSVDVLLLTPCLILLAAAAMESSAKLFSNALRPASAVSFRATVLLFTLSCAFAICQALMLQKYIPMII